MVGHFISTTVSGAKAALSRSKHSVTLVPVHDLNSNLRHQSDCHKRLRLIRSNVAVRRGDAQDFYNFPLHLAFLMLRFIIMLLEGNR
jgi:hypothetical protein